MKARKMRHAPVYMASTLLVGGGLVAGVLMTAQPEAMAAARKSPATRTAPTPSKDVVRNELAALPLSFEENRGQFDTRVRFGSTSGNAGFYLTSTDIVLTRISQTAKGPAGLASAGVSFEGDDESAAFRGEEALSGRVNRFIGQDESRWTTSVPTWHTLRREDAYEGVDIVVTSRGRDLEYRFHLDAGADASSISMSFPRSMGMGLDADGNLTVAFDGGRMTQSRPVAWQDGAEGRVPVKAGFVVRADGTAGIALGVHDASLPLVIDPVVDFSSYIGGDVDIDEAYDVAIDSQGRLLVCGFTPSNNFPTTVGAFQVTLVALRDAFVTRYTADRTAMQASTMLGGDNADYANAIGVDSSDRPVIAGRSSSSNYPVAGEFAATNSGLEDVVVTVFDEDLAGIAYSTYVGGQDNELAYDLDINQSTGEVVVSGTTSSHFFLATPFPGTASPASPAGFYLRVDPSMTGAGSLPVSIAYNLPFGPSDYRAIVLNQANGDVYVAGLSTSGSGLGGSGFDLSYNGGTSDAIVARMQSDGTVLANTLLGGNDAETAHSIDLDALGQVYVSGATRSANFNQVDSLFTHRGSDDIFIARLNPTLSTLNFSTLIGGSGSDTAAAMVVDAGGTVFVTGATSTAAGNFFPLPTLGVEADETLGGDSDAFLLKLSVPSRTLRYFSYLGGALVDSGEGITVDNTGIAYICGVTRSTDFPTVAPVDGVAGGTRDGFVARFVTATMSIDTAKGKIVEFKNKPDGPGRNKDTLAVNGKYTITDLGQELDFDPSVHGSDFVVGPSDQLHAVGIPAGDAGWTSKVVTGGMQYTWKKTISGIAWGIQVNTAKKTYKVNITKTNFNAGSGGLGLESSEEMVVSVNIGENEGFRVDVWSSAPLFSTRAEETLINP